MLGYRLKRPNFACGVRNIIITDRMYRMCQFMLCGKRI